MDLDTKTIYAQSSDIKSRTYLQYRKDMKQKAIAELEVLPWLREKIKKEKGTGVEVQKFGGDKFIWFLRKGGVTRDPDYVIEYPVGKTSFLEFQYAKEKIKAYDFKISKISPKDRKLKKRAAKPDTEILYIIKPTGECAFLHPDWIMKSSSVTHAAAWGNAPVYRIPAGIFEKKLKPDPKLKKVCESIDKKITILDFQIEAIDKEREKFSHLLQGVIDEKKILKILPQALDGFFKTCFILNHIDRTPMNINLWIIYLLSFLGQNLNSYELFQLFYSLDFLYSRTELQTHELHRVISGISLGRKNISSFVKNNGSYQSSKKISPLEDTRFCLFVINVLEDLTQDILHYYKEPQKKLKPINLIFQDIKNVDKTHKFITS